MQITSNIRERIRAGSKSSDSSTSSSDWKTPLLRGSFTDYRMTSNLSHRKLQAGQLSASCALAVYPHNVHT